jgi:hypothetical protein
VRACRSSAGSPRRCRSEVRSPRSMSEILALMTPDRAQQLTVELANRAKTSPKDPGANLPKIEGRPTGQ